MAYIVRYLNGEEVVVKQNSDLQKINYKQVKEVTESFNKPHYLESNFKPKFDINTAIPLYIIKKQIERGEISEELRKKMALSCKQEINYITTQIAMFYGEKVEDKSDLITSTDFGKMLTRLKALEYRIKVLNGMTNIHKKKNNTVIKTMDEVHNAKYKEENKVVAVGGFSLFG